MSLLLSQVSYAIIFVWSTVSNFPYHHPCLYYCVKFPTPSHDFCLEYCVKLSISLYLSPVLYQVSYTIVFVTSTVSNFLLSSSLSLLLCQVFYTIIPVSNTVSSLLHHHIIFVSSTVSNLPYHHPCLYYCVKSPTPSSLSLILSNFPYHRIIPVTNTVSNIPYFPCLTNILCHPCL